MQAVFLDDNEAEDTNRSIILHCVKKSTLAQIWHFVCVFFFISNKAEILCAHRKKNKLKFWVSTYFFLETLSQIFFNQMHIIFRSYTIFCQKPADMIY